MVWYGMVWYGMVCMYIMSVMYIYIYIYVHVIICILHDIIYIYDIICTVGRVITPSKATEITHGDSDIKNSRPKQQFNLFSSQECKPHMSCDVSSVLFNWRRSTGLRLLWRSWCRPETPEKQTVTTDVKIYQNISTY